MSEPSSAFDDFSPCLRSAAFRPTSGLAPAPRPLVELRAELQASPAPATASEPVDPWLAVINSTPSSLARIMRFQPRCIRPPPTPMTLIFAGCSSSLKLIRIPASLVVISSPSLLQFRLRPLGQGSTRRRRTWLSILIQKFSRALRRGSVAPSRHTERVRLRLHIPAAPTCSGRSAKAFGFRDAHGADGMTPRQVPPNAWKPRAAAGRRGQIRQGIWPSSPGGALQVVREISRKQFHWRAGSMMSGQPCARRWSAAERSHHAGNLQLHRLPS